MNVTSRPKLFVLVAAAAALVAGACSSVEISRPSGGPAIVNVFLQVPEGQTVSTNADGSFSIRVGDGTRELTVSSAQFIWDDVEFARVGGECTVSNTADDGDDCSERFVEPQLQSLPVNESPESTPLFTALLEPGVYERLQFALHQAEEGELEFLNEGFSPGTSVNVVGSLETADGSSTVDALFGPSGTVEVFLPTELTLQADQSVSLTLVVDVGSWFVAEDGTSVIDPNEATASASLAETVRQNIRESFSLEQGGG